MSFVHELRHALRAVTARPGFSLLTTLVLALGLGIFATLTAVLDSLVLAPPPGVSAPEEVVEVGRGGSMDTLSYPLYRALQEDSASLEGLAAYTPFDSLSSRLGESAEQIQGSLVTAGYFRLLGVAPREGRFPTADEDPRAAPWVVVSEDFRQRRLGDRPRVVGESLEINGRPFTIVAVAPAGFRGTFAPVAPAVWVPLELQPWLRPGDDVLEEWRANWLLMVGRLADGVTPERAEAELSTITASVAAERPELAGLGAGGVSVARAGALHPALRLPVGAFLGVLLGLTVLVLVVAVFHVSGLLLARMVGRQRELALRSALGASRRRLVAQLLAETGLRFFLGAAAGLALAALALRALPGLLGPLPVPARLDLSLDGFTLLTALGVTLGLLLTVGLAPALVAAPNRGALRLHGATESRSQGRLRGMLVAAQVALSVVLLLVGAVMVRTLAHSRLLDPGFDPRGVSLAAVHPTLGGLEEAEARGYHQRLLAEARRWPGVGEAALAADLPLDLDSIGYGGVMAEEWIDEGVETREGRSDLDADFNLVSPGYFRLLGIPLLRGRDFTPRDRVGAPAVTVVNQRLAADLWPGEDPLGRGLRVGGPSGTVYRVVGVARDGKYRSLGEDPRRFVWLPLAQDVWRSQVSLLVRGRDRDGIARGLPLRELEERVASLDPRVPVLAASSLEEVLAGGLLPQRIAAGVAGFAGVVGLALTLLGLWGLVAWTVARRTREVGIRLALGARPHHLLGSLLARTLGWALAGVAVGMLLSLPLGSLLGGLLLGRPLLDPLVVPAVLVLLVVVLLTAAALPARRALKVDPVAALRVE